MQVWNEAEVTTFLEAVKDTLYHALYYTALLTGARRSELLALHWQDIDLMFGVIRINCGLRHLTDGSYIFTQPKSAKSRRTIALPPSAIAVFREHRETMVRLGMQLADDDLVFCHSDGFPLRLNTVSRA